MPAQGVDNFVPAAVDDVLAQLLEGDVDDVVVVEFLGRHFVAEFEPEAVQQIDFLGRQPRGVRTEIENMLLASGRVDFQGQLRVSAPAAPSQAKPAMRASSGTARQDDIPRAMVVDCRLCAARRMPSHFCVAGATAR